MRFDDGSARDAIDAAAKKRKDADAGRYAPAFPAHCENAAASDVVVVVVPSSPPPPPPPYAAPQPSDQLSYTRLPMPVFRAAFHHGLASPSIAGDREYWNTSDSIDARARRRTDRRRPVVAGEDDPRHALHRDDAEAYAQYVRARDAVEDMEPPCVGRGARTKLNVILVSNFMTGQK